MPDVIDRFAGPYAGLSNFAAHHVVLDGVEYPSREAAFNAYKTLDPAERELVRAAADPRSAKAVGRRVTLRPGWDEAVRYEVMRSVVHAATLNPETRALLLSTGDALLIGGTTWHDQVWGQCSCEEHRRWPGANRLGRTLMAERAWLRGDRTDRWVRVAVTGHRPQHLSPAQQRFARAELDRLAAKLRDQHDTAVAISGMALGADTWWANSAVAAGLRLWAYVPFTAQPAKWTGAEQAEWRRLLNLADRRLVLAEDYDVRLLHARNDFMLRDADLVVAVWDPRKTTGGTASAVKKARAAGKPLVVIDLEQMRTRIEPGRPPAGATVRAVGGDLLTDDAAMLVNPVNTSGAMGRGLALAFRTRFPEMYEDYRRACGRRELAPGGVRLWVNPAGDGPRLVANLATKAHWTDPSRIEWIHDGVAALAGQIRALGVTSVAIPALGCGLGGLAWATVAPVIRDGLARLRAVDVRIYSPVG